MDAKSRKLLSAILAFAIILGMFAALPPQTAKAAPTNSANGFTLTVTPVASATTPFPFTDVPATAWYYNDVKTAWEQGLINGKYASSFAPGDDLTYAEAVKLAACMHQLYTTSSVTLTSSIAPIPWYQSFVKYAKDKNIINKDYVWNNKATRAGYMEIFANALPNSALAETNSIPNGSIPDVPAPHPQAAAIYKLYRAGIVQGVDGAHNCNPGSNIKRSEVAAILTRMMNAGTRIRFSIEQIYDWYLNQSGSGEDSYINCGPAVAVMAAKWYNRNFSGTIKQARDSIPGTRNEWWYYKHIVEYLRSVNVSFTYTYSYSSVNAMKWLDEGKIIIANTRMSDITFRNDSTRIGRFYSYNGGHFIILKGYYKIDGINYFEVYDPFTMNEYYSDGTPKGKDRLYLMSEVTASVISWGDGEAIVINPK